MGVLVGKPAPDFKAKAVVGWKDSKRFFLASLSRQEYCFLSLSARFYLCMPH